MARLETVFRPVVKQPPTEADLAFTSALSKLLATMDQKHARIVLNEVTSLHKPSIEGGTRFGNLTVAAGLEFELLAKNSLGERITASPAISGNKLFYRTDSHVYCIEAHAGH